MQPLHPHETPNPAAILRQWPGETPLAVRWAGHADGSPSVILGVPLETRTARTGTELESLLGTIKPQKSTPGAGWFGWISYDAGACFEPAAASRAAVADRDWPLACLQRIESAVTIDAAGCRGSGPAAEAFQRAIRADPAGAKYTLGPIDTEANREQYTNGVRRVIEYIRAGDAYQVNLAHRISTAFSGSTRAFFANAAETARPWHGGYIETDDYAIASLSPELFLCADLVGGQVRTRPMKGTRAYTAATDAAARDELARSDKDRAELAMIVDLMRNDLGRVCTLGTVRVEEPRRIEKHASGVLQSTATIAGTLRRGTTLLDLLRATFPPGSVTGAPKIRAMQIIDELEPVRRGPYCGTMLWAGDDGAIEANVMIRTAGISVQGNGQRTLDYAAGAGIVADSDPESEWAETLAKCQVLRPFG
ncbi:MAG: anthranilate synthase component I family protein [Planctomycetes bacterium]|nr:anthranilate synthase component I family protein [Planctomycetota bacterium]